jgi:hypothetical protein
VEEEKTSSVKEIELVEMTSKDTIAIGKSSELPLDTRLLTFHEKGSRPSVLSVEEEED